MFIFQRSIAGPLVALTLSAVLVVLDAMFQVGLAMTATVIGTACRVAFVAGVTLAVCGGIPYTILWAVYSMWRAS